MPYCVKCSKEIRADWKICPYCGTPNALSQESEDEKQKIKRTGTFKGDEGVYGLNPRNLPAGHKLEQRYRIEQKLGSGGFGTVYKAWDEDMECYKALKLIHLEYYDDKEVIADLKGEAILLKEIQSANVVRLWDIHLKGELKFIDLEYVDGGNLVELKLSYPDKKVPEEKVIDILKGIAGGMQAIHSHRIIHKDLKPQNVMLTRSGQVKIMDFGIAETFRSSQSRMKESSRSGTPAYMSPEQLIGENVGRESDIWSFGIMLYELLSGKQVFTGESRNDVLMQIERRKEYKKIQSVSAKLNALLEQCLQFEYKNRFHDFKEVLYFLESSQSISANQIRSDKLIITENMVFVEGGEFEMGDNFGDGYKEENPVHKVFVDSFLIGKYPVTQKQYEETTGINPSSFKREDHHPVETVSWYDAVEFCNKKSEKEGLQKCYTIDKSRKDPNNNNSYDNLKWIVTCDFTKNGYRLPTEAEWEYAAKGGKKSSRSYKFSGSSNLDAIGWYAENSNNRSHPVGEKQPNELGIYDMSGNVWEWCWDWYGSYSSSSQTNPKGASSGSSRVLRGGSWLYFDDSCRVAYRRYYDPYYGDYDFGFRLVRAG
ncbi:MAG: SUMF1/EgtB/PvdO family nonheme iron enzyme [Candidatus Delongbacteria bacterium]|nr:SUMF1/EgtB/PvdO family nonheme iron enzyme [Candidatus Delongbacteria bacterium]